MEAVDDDIGCRQLIPNAADEGWGHVAGHLFDLLRFPSMLMEISAEGGYGLAVPSRSDVQSPVFLDIDEQGHEVMPLAGGRLVDEHLRDAGIVRLPTSQFRVFAQHGPEIWVGVAAELGDSVDRHDLGQLQQESLEKQGKAMGQPFPRRGYLTVLPLTNIHPEDAGMQKADVLEKDHVTPGLLGYIVRFEYTIDAFLGVHLAE